MKLKISDINIQKVVSEKQFNYLEPSSFREFKNKISNLESEIASLKKDMSDCFKNFEIKCGYCGSYLFIDQCSAVNFYKVVSLDNYNNDSIAISDGCGICCYNCKCYMKFDFNSNESKTIEKHKNCFKNAIDIVFDTDYVGRPIIEIKEHG